MSSDNEKLSDSERETLQCNLCEKNFKKVQALSNHKKTHKNKHTAQCTQCGKTVCDVYYLKKHIAKVHGVSEKYRTGSYLNSISKCCLCTVGVPKSCLKRHYEECHQIQLVEESHTFKTMEEVVAWKEHMESDTTAKYVQQCAPRVNKNGSKVTYFYCHRGGYYKSKGKNIRHLKTLGSNKIDSNCPSNIVVKEKTSLISVQFCKTHVGHANDLLRLSLTPNEKDEIAQKIAMKVPLEDILDEIRDSLHDKNVKRIHLTSKQDLTNIIDQYKLNKEDVLHHNDYVNVDTWVKSMESTSNVIRFYKPQDQVIDALPELEAGDFCLIIASDAQLSLLKSYGNDVLCIDRIYCLNSYNFELYTILVLDHLREGVPCAFMFCNRGDAVVMELYFTVIKSVIDFDLDPEYFMSDMASSFYEGWSIVFPESRAKKLFCSWHVDKAWRTEIQNIPTNNQVLKADIYKQVKILMHEKDIVTFDAMAKHLLEQLHITDDTSSFAHYLEEFINKPHTWAYSHRLSAGINTNMHLENTHRTLQHIFLRGKKVQRLDKCIHTIMKFTKDKMYEHLITVEKGTLSKELYDNRNRHTKIDDSPSMPLVEEGYGEWIVLAENKELYTVTRREDDSTLYCSCNDSENDSENFWNTCVHIHAVCIKLQENMIEEPTKSSPVKKNDPTLAEVALINELENPVKNESIKEQKEKLLEVFTSLLHMANTQDKLDIVKKQIFPIKSLMRAKKEKRKSSARVNDPNMEPPNKISSLESFSTMEEENINCVPLFDSTPEEIETLIVSW